jgi:hypothetical protein
MTITLARASAVYRELLDNGARSSLNIDVLSKFIASARSEDELVACIDVAVSTPLRMCRMPSIVAQMVMWNRSKGRDQNGLSDKTKSVAEYIELMGGTGTALLAADTPLKDVVDRLKAARGSTTLLVQLMKERVLRTDPDVRAFVTQYFTHVWKIEQIAASRMIEALARKGGDKKSKNDGAAECWKAALAMTRDPSVLVDVYRTGKPVQMSGKLSVAPILLNSKIYNSASDAFAALGGQVKRDAAGSAVARTDAVATLKLDGYSLNISFFKEASAVRHSLSFRTKGNTCTIGAGMTAIAASIARALEDVDGFEQMIVGGEVLVMDADDVPLPSIHMHDWNKPGFKLGFVVYHMLLYNDVRSRSVQEDMRLIDDVFDPAFLQKATPANGFITTIASAAGLKHGGGTIALHAEVRTVQQLDAYFKQVCDASLEGVVVTNRRSGLAIGSRNANVLKMKPERLELDVVVYGFKTRQDASRIKEVLVGVLTDNKVVAYATVGNLTDKARVALRELFSRKKFGATAGHEVAALPAWLHSGRAKPDFHYMMPAKPDVLPAARIVGYPSKHLARTCGLEIRGVPASLTFPKLVQASVAKMMGLDAVADKKTWAANPFEMTLEELKGKESDSALFEGKVVELNIPDVADKLEYDNALELATELVRNSATVAMASTVEHSDYTINTEDDAEWSWVFQCVVAGRILPFPRPSEARVVDAADRCPHCGKLI